MLGGQCIVVTNVDPPKVWDAGQVGKFYNTGKWMLTLRIEYGTGGLLLNNCWVELDIGRRQRTQAYITWYVLGCKPPDLGPIDLVVS